MQLKGINKSRKRLADGRVVDYWYAWRGGPRISGAPGSPDFIASYNAAVAGRQTSNSGTLRWVLDAYQDSEEFRRLAPRTMKDYRRILSAIGMTFGDCPIKLLDDRRMRGEFLEWRDAIAKASRRQADYTTTVFARVLSWAKDRGTISVNVLKSPGRVWKGSRAEKVWTDEDEARLLAVASPPMALAFMLALWTGQRQGDLLRLPWGAYDGQFIRLRQSKTEVRVVIPVGAPLKAMLDATPQISPVMIISSDGRPYTSDGFRASWRKTCKRAGIVGLTFHDLRGTAVSRMASAEASEIEIATVTGLTVRNIKSIMDTHYLNRDPAMAISAVKKLEKRTKSANRSANRSLSVTPKES
jgi:integrase